MKFNRLYYFASLALFSSCNDGDKSETNRFQTSSDLICDCYESEISNFQELLEIHEAMVLETFDKEGPIDNKMYVDISSQIINHFYNLTEPNITTEELWDALEYSKLLNCIKTGAAINTEIKKEVEELDFIVVSETSSFDEFVDNVKFANEHILGHSNPRWLRPFLIHGILRTYQTYYLIQSKNVTTKIEEPNIVSPVPPPPPPPPPLPPMPVEDMIEEAVEVIDEIEENI